MRATALAVVLSILTGCASQYIMVSGVDPDPAKYEIVCRDAEGAGSGFFVAQIPIGITDAVARATQEAVASCRGDDIVNLRVQQRWYFTPLWLGIGARVKGDVVRKLTPAEQRERREASGD